MGIPHDILKNVKYETNVIQSFALLKMWLTNTIVDET